jgi:hypothetical protein
MQSGRSKIILIRRIWLLFTSAVPVKKAKQLIKRTLIKFSVPAGALSNYPVCQGKFAALNGGGITPEKP